jgi:hypothetical protein
MRIFERIRIPIARVPARLSSPRVNHPTVICVTRTDSIVEVDSGTTLAEVQVNAFNVIVAIFGIFLAVIGIYYARRQFVDSARVAESQEEFKAERAALNNSRNSLGLRAAVVHQRSDPTLRILGSAGHLTRDGLIFQKPIPLSELRLNWRDEGTGNAFGVVEAGRGVLPLKSMRSRFLTYSEAMAELCRPGIFENRLCCRLADVTITGEAPVFTFSRANYFEMIDNAEALGHEFHLACDRETTPSWRRMPLRSQFRDDIFSLGDRVVAPSIVTLTLIRRRRDPWSFVMHWRDPAEVGTSGNMMHVIPAGMFQPASAGAMAVRRDLDLWRNIMREMAEELLGIPEASGKIGDSIDYEHMEPYASLQKARTRRQISVWCFGIGMDPLTLTVEILTVAVIDETVFSKIFANLVSVNEEGIVIRRDGSAKNALGIDFTEQSIREYSSTHNLTPSAGACLQLAWRHRKCL